MKKAISFLLALASLLALTAVSCFAEIDMSGDGTVSTVSVDNILNGDSYITTVTYNSPEHFKLSIPASLDLNSNGSGTITVSLSDGVLDPDRTVSVYLDSKQFALCSVSDNTKSVLCNITGMTDESDAPVSFERNSDYKYTIAEIKGINAGNVGSCTRKLNLQIANTTMAGMFTGQIVFEVKPHWL